MNDLVIEAETGLLLSHCTRVCTWRKRKDRRINNNKNKNVTLLPISFLLLFYLNNSYYKDNILNESTQ